AERLPRTRQGKISADGAALRGARVQGNDVVAARRPRARAKFARGARGTARGLREIRIERQQADTGAVPGCGVRSVEAVARSALHGRRRALPAAAVWLPGIAVGLGA